MGSRGDDAVRLVPTKGPKICDPEGIGVVAVSVVAGVGVHDNVGVRVITECARRRDMQPACTLRRRRDRAEAER